LLSQVFPFRRILATLPDTDHRNPVPLLPISLLAGLCDRRVGSESGVTVALLLSTRPFGFVTITLSKMS
jgi:hypothetical protein